jgi:SnoaL-like protein
MERGGERAMQPEDLSRFLVERLNAGDVAGLVELYEADAVLALPDGSAAVGGDQIGEFYRRLLVDRPHFQRGVQRPTLRTGDLALMSTALGDGVVTAEVARRQADGTWLWVLDQPGATRSTGADRVVGLSGSRRCHRR